MSNMNKAKYKVNFLNVGRGMQDGDDIDVKVVAQPDCPKHRVKISLALGEGVRWWKGLVLYSKEKVNYWQTVAELQDDQCPVTMEIDYHLLSSNDLVLCKAKMFGKHTPVYHIVDAEYVLQPGNCYAFTWNKD